MCGLSLFALGVQLIHLQPFRVARSRRGKASFSRRWSRAARGGPGGMQVGKEGQAPFLGERHLLMMREQREASSGQPAWKPLRSAVRLRKDLVSQRP